MAGGHIGPGFLCGSGAGMARLWQGGAPLMRRTRPRTSAIHRDGMADRSSKP